MRITPVLALLPALLLSTAALASSSSVIVRSGDGRADVSTSSSGAVTSGAATSSASGSSSSAAAGSTAEATSSAAVASDESIRKVLTEQGFTEIRDIERRGTGYSARAMKDGREVTVEISASTLGDDNPRR